MYNQIPEELFKEYCLEHEEVPLKEVTFRVNCLADDEQFYYRFEEDNS